MEVSFRTSHSNVIFLEPAAFDFGKRIVLAISIALIGQRIPVVFMYHTRFASQQSNTDVCVREKHFSHLLDTWTLYRYLGSPQLHTRLASCVSTSNFYVVSQSDVSSALYTVFHDGSKRTIRNRHHSVLE